MTDLPPAARRELNAHDAFEPTEEGFRLTTTVLDGAVVPAAGPADHDYRLVIRAPTLAAATADEVGDSLAEGWFETFALRLEDAPTSTRHDVTLETCDVRVEGEEVVADLAFGHDEPGAVPAIARALVEYAEGTYVEGVVPGFDYEEPVATLLGQATQEGGGERGGTPL